MIWGITMDHPLWEATTFSTRCALSPTRKAAGYLFCCRCGKRLVRLTWLHNHWRSPSTIQNRTSWKPAPKRSCPNKNTPDQNHQDISKPNGSRWQLQRRLRVKHSITSLFFFSWGCTEPRAYSLALYRALPWPRTAHVNQRAEEKAGDVVSWWVATVGLLLCQEFF